MYCNACGNVKPNDAALCAKCGSALKRPMTQEPALEGETTNSEQPTASAGTSPDRNAAPRSEPAEALDGKSGDEWRAVIGPMRCWW